MPSCLLRIALFERFVESYPCSAFVIFVVISGKSFGSHNEIGGSLGVCPATIEQFAHLIVADRKRQFVVGLFEDGNCASERAFGGSVLLEG